MRQGRYRTYPTPAQEQIAASGKKHCGRCHRDKSVHEFGVKARSTCGYSSYCQECNREYDRDNTARFRSRKRHRWYMRTYGISYKAFRGIIHRQKGLCAICHVVMDEPHLDHCPVTGRIRGVLCHKCNVGLGHFGDDPALLNRAITYLGEDNG